MNLLIHNLFTTVQRFKLKKWEILVNPGSEKNSTTKTFLKKSLPVQSFDDISNITMKFLWLHINNNQAKMASTATLSLDLSLFSCPSFLF